MIIHFKLCCLFTAGVVIKNQTAYLQKNIFIFCVTVSNEPSSKTEDGSIDQEGYSLGKGKCNSINGSIHQAGSEEWTQA